MESGDIGDPRPAINRRDASAQQFVTRLKPYRRARRYKRRNTAMFADK
jgi:hypothetical protein